MSEKKLIIHHATAPIGTVTTCGGSVPIDYLIDRYASVVTNYDSVCSRPGAHRDSSQALHLCVEGNFEQTPLSPDLSRVTADLVKHLSRIHGILPKDIIAHRDQFQELGQDAFEMCPGIYLCQHLATIRSELERDGSSERLIEPYDAFFEVLGVSERTDSFEVAGWVTNVGSEAWFARNDEWHVSLGLKAISEASEPLLERRYPIPSGGIAPGEGFSFRLAAGAPYSACSRLEFGLVIDNKFWFANNGLRPLAFRGVMRGSLVMPGAMELLKSKSVSILALATDESPEQHSQWVRTGLHLDDETLEPDSFIQHSQRSAQTSIDICNSTIAARAGRDLVIVSRGVQFQDPTWLATLQRAAHADPVVAAVSAILSDSQGRVVDIGGTLYSTGYTHSPGFLRAPQDRMVATKREPGFLPVGAVYFRHDALEQVGCFNTQWRDLQLALIEWCYRARSLSMRVRVAHPAVAVVPARHLSLAMQPTISGYALRRALLDKLADVMIEGRYV